MRISLTGQLEAEVKNAAARAGVRPLVLVKAAVRRFLEAGELDEISAEDDPEAAETLRRRRVAERAAKVLSERG